MKRKTLSLIEDGDQLKAVFRPPLSMTRLFDITASDRPIGSMEGSDTIYSLTYDRRTFVFGMGEPYENFVSFHAERMSKAGSGQRRLDYELVQTTAAEIGQKAVAGQDVARPAA